MYSKIYYIDIYGLQSITLKNIDVIVGRLIAGRSYFHYVSTNIQFNVNMYCKYKIFL